MWRTPIGERTLTGPEADLVRAAVADVVNTLEEEAAGLADVWPCGVRMFDELPWQQRLALLASVAEALLDPNISAPELSAVNEATVAALFAHVERNLTIELDDAADADLSTLIDCYYWRRLLVAGQGEPNDEFYMEVNSRDLSDWAILIEGYQDHILWDADWDMPELFLDVDPAICQLRKDFLGIDDDYYTFPAPDLHDADAPALFAGLRQLIGQ
jgi:hypothetical protein